MGQDKQKLEQLLDFVARIYADKSNKEFIDGIRALVFSDKGLPVAHGEAASLDKITTYLSLDYDLDEKDFPDYSFICEESVRETLLVDFREMLRYQYGTRNHKVDFPEFCRYATLQIEMLVNYYFERKYASDLAKIIQVIKDGNTTEKDGETICYFNPNPKTKDVADIGLKFKIQALQSQFAWQYSDISDLLNVVEVRNRQSHRSLRLEKDKIQEYEARFKAAKVWYFQESRPMYKKALEQGVITPKEKNEYSFQVWLDCQPFDEIIRTIKSLATAVSKAIIERITDTKSEDNKKEEEKPIDTKPEELEPEESKVKEEKESEIQPEEQMIEEGKTEGSSSNHPSTLHEAIEKKTGREKDSSSVPPPDTEEELANLQAKFNNKHEHPKGA